MPGLLLENSFKEEKNNKDQVVNDMKRKHLDS